MKGQLVFEFMIAVVIFFGIMLYVLNYLNGEVAGYSRDFYSESVESKASQIGELLVLNRGSWTPSGGLAVAGLAEDWPVLNRTKISWLNASCNNNYQRILDNLGVSVKNRLKIIINETKANGAVSNLVNCPAAQTVGLKRTEARRYALVADASSPGVMNAASIYIYLW